MSRSLDQILSDYRATRSAVQTEEKQRQEIIDSPEFQSYQRIIDDAMREQARMLAKVPDSREEATADAEELKKYMQEQGIRRAGEFVAKVRAKRSVDVNRVLETIGGDLGLLMEYASMTQTNLKQMQDAMPDLKKELKACVRDEGEIIVDVVLAEDSSPSAE